MANYVAGDRLWVRLDGFDWWPARVLTDEELEEKLPGQSRDPAADLAFLFYAGSTTGESIGQLNSDDQAANMCFFETSSQKAVTDSDDLRGAIEAAANDLSANPLKVDDTPVATMAGAHAAQTSAAAAAAKRKAGKRGRGGDDSDSDDDYAGRRGGGGCAAAAAAHNFERLSVDRLRSIAERIGAASAADGGDLAALRIALCDLDRVDVVPSELEESKIGVAVGGILGREPCRPLWPLARALVSFWARHLNPETLKAISRVQDGTRSANAAAAAMAGAAPGSPTSPGGRYTSGAGGFGSPMTTTLGSPASVLRSRGGPHSPQRKSFFATLCEQLDSPNNSVSVPSATIEKMARSLVDEIVDEDERVLLLSRLANIELPMVRENLITGRWTAKQYAEQPKEAFVTDREKTAEEHRIAEKIQAFENAKMAGVNVTAMFKCDICNGRNCSFHEQQTRGADEPTTKFISCLDCKRTWTEE